MDIRNWSMDRIMQLPDEVFGRRWFVGVSGTPGNFLLVFDISESALPDMAVIWGLVVTASAESVINTQVVLRLGNKLPASAAEFDAMELLFPAVMALDGVRSSISIGAGAALSIPNMRMPVAAQGRRLVVSMLTPVIPDVNVAVTLLVSGIPSNVPDFLVNSDGERSDEIIRLLRIGAKLPE